MKQLQKIPFNWKETTLNHCVSSMRSGLSRLLSETDIGIPVLRSCNIGIKYPVFENLKFWYELDPEGANTSSYILKNGDILVNFINSISQIGKTCIFRNDIGRDCIYTTNILRLIPNKNILGEFLFLITQMDRYNWYITTITKPAVNQASFTTKDFKKYLFLLPPLPEQKAITDLLSTWDQAIERTEMLIKVKEKQFKWLLLTLMSEPSHKTGNNEWKKVKLGEVCKVTTGQSAPQDLSIFTNSGFPFIRVSSLDLLLGRSDSVQTEYITKTKGHELKMTLFKPGTILFAKSGMSALQARVCKLKEPSFIVSHLCALIPSSNIHEDFLMYYLMKYHPNRLIQGDGFPSIKTSEVSSLKILLPPFEEQKKIVEMLSFVQQEINLLKQLAEKYKTQKRGLMQKMLTGKWRVKPEIINQYKGE
ncbi:restriction endonuclease subunit S [Otariodibacter sp.]|uniref:restriction endonuclease subunit S n=1 Tax=Otariodibacter sp. TaxID=3030919 RepID=UPI0026092EE4|nr:restriction endonuclease subunit S [Otariodibacter sp.]